MICKTLIFIFATGPTVLASVATAAPAEIGISGWFDVPTDATDQITLPTEADLLRLADLDGDLDVITSEEHQMMAVLRQVLGLPTVSN